MIHLIFFLILNICTFIKCIPTFPGAEGFGAETVGGRFGDNPGVFFVTSLEDSGPGTLRQVLSEIKQKSEYTGVFILFKAVGIITLNSTLKIDNMHHLTIAGQTAAGVGIELRVPPNPDDNFSGPHLVSITSSSHIVIQFMKFRCTLPRNTSFGGNRVNGVYIEDTHNVMIDHVSVAFCSDALLHLRYHSNVTVQHSALTHPRGRASGDYVNAIYLKADSTAGSTGHTTFHRNLLSHAYTVASGSVKAPVEFIGNIIYNWIYFGLQSSFVDNGLARNYQKFIRNAFLRGPATRGRRPVRFQGNVSNNQYYYVWENIDDNRVHYMTLEGLPTFNDTTAVRQQTRSAQFESWWRVVTDCSSASDTHCASLAPTEWLVEDEPRFKQAHPVTRPSMAEDVISEKTGIWDQVGASLPARDEHDRQFILEARNRNGTIEFTDPILRQFIAAPVPMRDRDEDGLPNSFESKLRRDVQPFEVRSDGYTMLEEYLASLTHNPLLPPSVPFTNTSIVTTTTATTTTTAATTIATTTAADATTPANFATTTTSSSSSTSPSTPTTSLLTTPSPPSTLQQPTLSMRATSSDTSTASDDRLMHSTHHTSTGSLTSHTMSLSSNDAASLSSTAAPAVTTLDTKQSVAVDNANAPATSDGLNLAGIIAIVVAVVVCCIVATLIGGALWLKQRRRRRRRATVSSTEPHSLNSVAPATLASNDPSRRSDVSVSPPDGIYSVLPSSSAANDYAVGDVDSFNQHTHPINDQYSNLRL